MLFAALLVYLRKEQMLYGDGVFGFGFAAACELAAELGIFAAWLLK